MNLDIPVVKDLKNNENIDDAIKYVIDEIKTQFTSNIERSSNSYVELSLNPEFSSPLSRYLCTVYVRENPHRERDEETGDIYYTYEGVNIELSWPSFGGVDVELCQDVLKLYTSVNDKCIELKNAYTHKLIRLSKTRNAELCDEETNKKRLNENALTNFIESEVSNMRVSSKFRTRSIVNGPHVDEGDYTIEIRGKTYFCNVSGLEVTFSRTK
jgi:hypothetical protein